MGLYDFIYNLQKKPLKHRRQVLVFLLIVSFAFLAVFWVVSFKNQIHRSQEAYDQTGSESLNSVKENILSPTAALIGGFKNMVSDISVKIKEYNTAIGGVKDTRARPVYELPEN